MSNGVLSYFEPVEIDKHLHYYIWQGRGNNCNSCLFTNILPGSKPHVIIDPGHTFNEFRENCFSALEKAIEKDGFKIEDIGLIINTHSHADHCQANELIAQRCNAGIALSEEEDTYRRTLGERMSSMMGIKAPQFKPSFFLSEGDLTRSTNTTIGLHALLTPGHSPGSICLYWPANKILITGDVVFFGSVGRTDFPGGNTTELENSIDRLAGLDVECLLPGHNTEYGSIIKGKKLVEQNFLTVKTLF